MSAHQTRSQRKASKTRHRAIEHLRRGGVLRVGRRRYMLAWFGGEYLFGQLVCQTDDWDNVMEVPRGLE